VALLRGAAAWRCCLALLLGAAAWRCCLALLLGAAAWRCCLALLLGAAAWRCCLALLLAHAASPRRWSTLLVHAAGPRCWSTLLVHATVASLAIARGGFLISRSHFLTLVLVFFYLQPAIFWEGRLWRRKPYQSRHAGGRAQGAALRRKPVKRCSPGFQGVLLEARSLWRNLGEPRPRKNPGRSYFSPRRIPGEL
jgi:hypothetical protein